MSAFTVTLRTEASEVPAVIAGKVNLMRFSAALASAGLVGRHDADRGVLVIEPAEHVRRTMIPQGAQAAQHCAECGGTGFDEDARCDFCDGTGREGCASG